MPSRTVTGAVVDARCSVASVHFVIMGCGRVGSTLAAAWRPSGHEVAVIDQDASAFRRLGTRSRADRSPGVGFDRDTLRGGRHRDAYAFAAVSSGDNSNILAARVARETFGVEHVVARIYDPRPRQGLPAARHPHRRHGAVDGRPDAAPAAAPGRRPELTDPSGKIVIAEVPLADGLGRSADQPRSRSRPAPGSPT